MNESEKDDDFTSEIAIIGMTGRFPGARNIEELWENLRNGVESITFFSAEELRATGLDERILHDPHLVNARGVLDDIELFDANFFGFTPREADILDPQQRLFLECAWEALERAGYDAENYAGRIGVFGGASRSSYLLANLYANPHLPVSFQSMSVLLATDKDFLTTRVSYKLNLHGPSLNVNTACSTSLVAIHVACQSLLNGECEMALAGGSTVMVPHRMGYLYEEGGVASSDGHCRAFDARAEGMVDGNGVGVIVLKRLNDAVADGDTICAVIKGTAINNDGSLKVGFTAPSVDGQAQVILEALAMADVSPETITYVEAHGTATPLGDPIEVAALTQAFRASTEKTGYCAIGSLKTNVGHMDAAAGVGGLIKTVLALQHKELPPSLHFERPNPAIDFATSPFYVNAHLALWQTPDTPRRAGVSSFGIGGTNAHAILEEAPDVEPSGPSRPWQLLLLSAKTPTALETATTNLRDYLNQHPEVNLADAAYTLQVGRRGFTYRRALVCQQVDDAVTALDTLDPERLMSAVCESTERSVVFMFPGGGAQYPRMGLQLYQDEPVFREQIDHCADLLSLQLRLDLRELLYGTDDTSSDAAQVLSQPALALPALFVTEYALAQLWMSWGVQPQALIGHSLGEYVAACLAGVISLEDALAMVVLRGQLFEDLPLGSMLSVPLPEQDVLKLLAGVPVSIAAINGPSLCVVSGTVAVIEAAKKTLAQRGIEARLLQIAVAAHSPVVEPILETFSRFAAGISLHPPRIPYLSNVTGTWITAEEATDPGYWPRHLRHTVRFADGLHHLLCDTHAVLLEVGPGQTLCSLARQHPDKTAQQAIIPSMRHPQTHDNDEAFLLNALGRLWLAGFPVDWTAFSANELRQRIVLPTYPFERQRYWIEPPQRMQPAQARDISAPGSRNSDATTSSKASVGDDLPLQQTASSLHPRPNLLNAYVAPRDATQEQLALLWQDVLGIEQIGIHDNFFELGGHSLLATQLVARLRETFSITLPLRAVLEAPTIAKLAQSIAESASVSTAPSSEYTPLVPIQLAHAGSQQQPLYCIHPVGGNVLCYADLARHLGDNQPFYGLEAPGVNNDREPFTRIEEMATYYLNAIQAHEPHGPYQLGGWSFGGLVAFEMAQQLLASGEEIALLALFDTGLPDADRQYIHDDAMMVAWFTQDLLGHLHSAATLTYQDMQPLNHEQRLQAVFEQVRSAGLFAADQEFAHLQRLFHTFQSHMIAMLNYAPQSYSGRVHLFQAEQNNAQELPIGLGWEQFAGGGVEVQRIPGNHYTIVREPFVQTLAQHLHTVLARPSPDA